MGINICKVDMLKFCGLMGGFVGFWIGWREREVLSVVCNDV